MTRSEDDAFAARFRAAIEPEARRAIDSATKPYREMVKALAITGGDPMTEIPAESHTYITTFTVDEGTPKEREYDALVIDLPDILDAIAAEGLPVACPECGALASMTIPLKDCKAWEISGGHRPECSAVAERPNLRVLDTRAGAEPHGES